MLLDCNVLKTKSSDLSLIRILSITLTMLISIILGILNINTRAEQLHLKHVLNIICYDVCPNYMKENFIKLSILHSDNTKGSNSSCSLYHYNAIRDWNRLPDNITSILLKSTFKKDVKTQLLNHIMCV